MFSIDHTAMSLEHTALCDLRRRELYNASDANVSFVAGLLVPLKMQDHLVPMEVLRLSGRHRGRNGTLLGDDGKVIAGGRCVLSAYGGQTAPQTS